MRSDAGISHQTQRFNDESLHGYCARKIWQQAGRKDLIVVRCKVERLIRFVGLQRLAHQQRWRGSPPDPVDRKFNVA